MDFDEMKGQLIFAGICLIFLVVGFVLGKI